MESPVIIPKKKGKRLTFGYLIESSTAFGGFVDSIWKGMAKAARAHDVNLFMFAGGAVDTAPYNVYIKELNIVYELIDKETIDGLIINGSLGNYVSQERFKAFYERFTPLPVVIIAGIIKGLHDVHVNNKNGMRDMITHLINKHGFRRFAFIKGISGHPDAEERFQVFRELLAENGLPYEPELVREGFFQEEGGAEATDYLLKSTDGKFDAIIASNDAMAIGAIKALRKHNIHVPSDMAVVGFDDIQEARAFTPPLTTARQPFDDMCSMAIGQLISMVTGKNGEDQGEESCNLPAELIIRRSCGCFATEVTDAGMDENIRFFISDENKAEPDINCQALLELMSAEMKTQALKVSDEQFKNLITQFVAEIKGEVSNSFLLALNELLISASLNNAEITVWQSVLSALRQNLFLLTKDQRILFKMENLINQARVLVGEVSEYTQNFKRIMEEKQSVLLRDVSQSFLTAFDYQSLKSTLLSQLPRLDIPSCFVFMVADINKSTDTSKMICGYRNSGKQEIDTGAEGFKPHALPPQDLLPWDRRFTYAVHPLYTRGKRLGYILFELGPEDGFIYDSLQLQISSSLMGSILLEQRERTESLIREHSNNIQELIKPMLASIGEVTQITNEKTALMNNLTLLTKENSDKLSSTNQFIEQMGAKIYNMLDMINLIDEISVAVNTIAINASIQAARVGKYGSGFAIIATEIRKLADSIKGYTAQISGFLESIRVNMDNSSQAGKDSLAAFKQLEGDVQAVALDLQAIKSIMDSLSATSAQILAVMKEE